MNQKSSAFRSVISLVSVSVLAGITSANAATITGSGTIEFGGAVNLSVLDNSPTGVPLGIEDSTVLDFLPAGGGDGDIVTLFPEEATGGFSEFGVGVSPATPNVSIIIDFLVSGGGGLDVVEPFLIFQDPPDDTLTGNDFFNLTDVGQVDFNELRIGDFVVGTIVSVPVTGTFISDTGEIFDGFGVFSTAFEGLNEIQIQQALLDGVENQAFSASFTSVDRQNIPEPTSIVSLGVLLVGSALSLRTIQTQRISR